MAATGSPGCGAVGEACAATPVVTVEKEEHAGEDHAGHPHAAVSREDVFTAMCEHKILLHVCAECRYEGGVVKVEDKLLRNEASPAGLIEVVEAVLRKPEGGIEAVGEIRLNPGGIVHVSPPVDGVLRALAVDVGALVQEGDALFEIESVELGRAVGEYRKCRALEAMAKEGLAREERLVAQQAGTEADRNEARIRYEQHRAELEAAGRQVQAMGLDLATLEKREGQDPVAETGKLVIRASRSGRVIERRLALGEKAERGKAVLVVADLSSVRVCLDIYEQDLAAVMARARAGGASAVVSLRAFPGEEFIGRLERLEPVADEGSRTVKAWLILNNPGERLKPGMFCRARIEAADGAETLALPKEALLTDEGQSFVFRHARGPYYLKQPVVTGRRFPHTVEILKGLAAGDRVVGRGSFLLKSDVLREKMGAGCAD